jgi:hypothetical protein
MPARLPPHRSRAAESIGNTITIVSFSEIGGLNGGFSGGKDYSTPQGEITCTLIPQ